jgi:hypothetical protein
MLESSVDKEKKKDHPDDYHIEWSILLNIIGTKILRFFILKEWKKRIIPFVFSLVKKNYLITVLVFNMRLYQCNISGLRSKQND